MRLRRRGPDERTDVAPDDRPARRTGYDLTRASFTLAGVAGAGFLIWIATTVGDETDARWWISLGIVAGAGLALALSQLLGGWTKWGIPRLSTPVLLLAFLPAAVCVGWILLTTQPDGGWQQGRFVDWSADLGLLNLVRDLGTYAAPALALGLGALLGFSFDTTGSRRRRGVDRPDDAVMDRRDAGEPLTAERTTATTTAVHDRDETVDDDLVAARRRDTPAAPPPDPEGRPSRPLDDDR